MCIIYLLDIQYILSNIQTRIQANTQAKKINKPTVLCPLKMHHCESASFLHLLIYHRVVYFAYLMALRDDMPLTLVVFWSNFNIHYLDSASLACLCLCLRLHVCACCQTSVFHLLLKRCFPVRTSLTATFSTHKNDNAGTQRKKKKTGDSNVKYNC